MDLRQLEYAVAVAEELSFTRAARRCHVVQSALSHQIQRLEAELDTRLFERTSRSVQVTAAGEVFVEHAHRTLATVRELRAELDALAGLERGEVSVGATQTAGRVLDLIALFGDFNRRHSGIRLRSVSGPASELMDDVRAGRLDVAFVTGDASGGRTGTPPSDGAIHSELLVAREPLVAVVGAAHRLAGRRSVRLAELAAGGGFVEFRAGPSLRETVDRAFAERELSRPVVLELGRISDMVRFASHGPVAAIVPRAFAVEPPAGAAPYTILTLREDIAMSVSAIRRRGTPGVALRAFLEVLYASSNDRDSRSRR